MSYINSYADLRRAIVSNDAARYPSTADIPEADRGQLAMDALQALYDQHRSHAARDNHDEADQWYERFRAAALVHCFATGIDYVDLEREVEKAWLP